MNARKRPELWAFPDVSQLHMSFLTMEYAIRRTLDGQPKETPSVLSLGPAGWLPLRLAINS
jgi:hypothetical protein